MDWRHGSSSRVSACFARAKPCIYIQTPFTPKKKKKKKGRGGFGPDHMYKMTEDKMQAGARKRPFPYINIRLLPSCSAGVG
jgi:hypothetical protein